MYNMVRNKTFIFLILFCVASICSAQTSYKNMTISLTYTNEPLRFVLNEITKQTNITFVYSDELIKDKYISCNLVNRALNEVLQHISKQTRIQFNQKGQRTFVLSQDSSAKSIVHGYIYDENGSALAGTNVHLKELQLGDISDENGYYEIRNVKQGEYHLIVSFIGFKKQEVPIQIIDSRSKIDFRLISLPLNLSEIVIIGSHLDDVEKIETTSVDPRKTKDMPGSIADVYRTVKMLPGVSINNNTSSEFSVRGGDPRENLVLLDGNRLERPFHLQDWGRKNIMSISVLNMDLMEQVTFSNGGFSARYGDKLSSVLNIKSRKGNSEEFVGHAGVNFFNCYAVVESPIPKGSFIFSVRRGYLDFLIGMMGQLDRLKPKYYDSMGAIDLQFKNLLVNANFLISGDEFLIDAKDSEGDYYTMLNGQRAKYTGSSEFDRNSRQNNKYFNFNTKYLFNPRSFLTWRFNYYNEHLSSSMKKAELAQFYDINYNYYGNMSLWNRDKLLEKYQSSMDLDLILRSNWKITAGCGMERLDYKHHLNNYKYTDRREILDTDTLQYRLVHEKETDEAHNNGYKINGFMENHINYKNFLLNLGFRIDYFSENKQWCYSPRFQMRYQISHSLNLKAVTGLYYQFPDFEQFYTQKAPEAARVLHVIFGIDKTFSENMVLKLELYRKDMTHLPAPLEPGRNGDAENIWLRSDRSKGYAYGFEGLFQFAAHAYSGWLSYAWSVAKEKYDQTTIFRDYDQRHTISFIVEKYLNEKTSIKAKWSYGSGYPYTSPVIEYVQSEGNEQYELIEQAVRNNKRYPAFHQLDIRLTRNVKLWGLSCSYYVEILNVYNRKNVLLYDWETVGNFSAVKITPIKGVPFVPFAGITFSF